MKEVLIGIALAAIAALVVPAFAADNDQLNKNGTQQYDPGTGGQSKAGQNGLPGNKSGATDPDANSGAATGEEGMESADPNTGNAAGSDNAKVPGKPGNKSGPSAAPSDSMSK